MERIHPLILLAIQSVKILTLLFSTFYFIVLYLCCGLLALVLFLLISWYLSFPVSVLSSFILLPWSVLFSLVFPCFLLSVAFACLICFFLFLSVGCFLGWISPSSVLFSSIFSVQEGWYAKGSFTTTLPLLTQKLKCLIGHLFCRGYAYFCRLGPLN